MHPDSSSGSIPAFPRQKNRKPGLTLQRREVLRRFSDQKDSLDFGNEPR